jgi:hypothetical protein
MNEAGATVVAETNDEIEANLWADALRDAGFRSGVIMRGPAAALGGVAAFPSSTFQVLVERIHLDSARSVIADLGGASRLAPVVEAPQGNPMRIAWLMAGGIAAFLAFGLILRAVSG